MDDGGEETETTPEADNKSQEDSMTEDEILKKYFEDSDAEKEALIKELGTAREKEPAKTKEEEEVEENSDPEPEPEISPKRPRKERQRQQRRLMFPGTASEGSQTNLSFLGALPDYIVELLENYTSQDGGDGGGED